MRKLAISILAVVILASMLAGGCAKPAPSPAPSSSNTSPSPTEDTGYRRGCSINWTDSISWYHYAKRNTAGN